MLQAFKIHAEQELKRFAARLTEMRVKVEEVGKAIESMESYSYQYDVKIVGVLKNLHWIQATFVSNYSPRWEQMSIYKMLI